MNQRRGSDDIRSSVVWRLCRRGDGRAVLRRRRRTREEVAKVDTAGGEVRRFWVPKMRSEKESLEPFVGDEVVAAIAGCKTPSCGVAHLLLYSQTAWAEVGRAASLQKFSNFQTVFRTSMDNSYTV
ncbi:hypothetical protein RHSIM_Rhsim01G0065200 [Rhododendron simsii]|uniref:Uncharacterized protein n=1 Tax=Rhododendron simsii TaxID=118357 RepID=A0A834LYR7_RHOSS|nr:hypothetical protein RHSIM_Rhsim01G0065200 [Rhododendron simsii]